MKTLIVNEFKESSKNYLIVLLGAIIGLIGVAYSVLNDIENSFIGPIVFFLIFGVFVFIFVVYLVTLIGDFKSDFFTDKAQVKFTLPIGSKSYLGAKIINTLVWQIILLLGIALTSFIIGYFIYNRLGNENFFDYIVFPPNAPSYIVVASFFGIIRIIDIVSAIMTLFFSIVVTKAIFRNSKNGNMWFFIFLGLAFIVAFIGDFLYALMPANLIYDPDLSQFLIEHGQVIKSMDPSYINSIVLVPLVKLFLSVGLAIAMFFGASYLIKEKIDF